MIDDQLVTSLPLFQSLSPAARDVVRRSGGIRRFTAGQVIFSAGTAARGLFVIVSGRVRITVFHWGRPHAIHEEVRGGTLGEVPLYAGGGYPATAVAAEATSCILLSRDHLSAVLQADPGWSWVLLERLAQRVRALVGRLDRNTAQAVPGRLAAFLLERHATGSGGAFALGRTQQQVAEDVGTVREVVVRTLARFRRAGLIRAAGRGRYEVSDPARLSAIAEGPVAEVS